MLVEEDRSPPGGGFLRRISRSLRFLDQTGTAGAPFVYDEIDRSALDAVVVAAHFVAEDSEGRRQRYVVFRSAARPPVYLRQARRSPISEPDNRGLWELPAGLVEESEQSGVGLLKCAARELEEEAGFVVSPDQLQPLGPSTFPAPGMCAERHFFFHVEVDPERQGEPSLDGSPLEAVGKLVAIPLAEALRSAQRGLLADAKTELALRRLAEIVED
jgi:ADP-ribose pyrophosphatase